MPDPDRFQTARSTLMVDRFMTSFIKIGGLAIIAAVFAIFVFILLEILPLFRSAQVESTGVRQGPAGEMLVFGCDEWSQLPFTLSPDGTFHLLPANGAPTSVKLPLADGETLTAATYDQRNQLITMGTSRGRILQASPNYRSIPEPGGSNRVESAPALGETFTLGLAELPVRQVAFAESDSAKLLAVLQDIDGRPRLTATAFTVTRTMMGASTVSELWRQDLTELIPGRLSRILVDGTAEHIVVATEDGSVAVLAVGEAEAGATLFQEFFQPFGDLPDRHIATIDFLLGDVSLVMCSSSGENRIYSLFIDERKQKRQYGLTRELPPLAGTPTAYTRSLRNKAYLLADDREASLRFATSATVRWQQQLDFAVSDAAISGKYDRVFLREVSGLVHEFSLDDPHPEAGLRAFFGPVWYEGASKPAYEWQSSGASDDFEPKLSLIPLIIGTLKGTFYAMLFAVPIALLGAIYTSEFMNLRFKRWVKPTIEVMASLPSVVLGFLAALWLAPMLEDRVPSVLACVIGLPVVALALGWGWSRLPDRHRSRLRAGNEIVLLLPVMLLALWVLSALGIQLERLCFDGDFRQWWPRATGCSYEQRNSLVVGFMMGFAVIPIIFTIVEDALSNVPSVLRSGSLALGASRWQTAMRVVMPTASAGILSAIMIGLGRAVGETMIVVMATGNTAVMDFNIFNGMRTLSANIAVELPEAPHASTLYRSLFLGAMILFLMTFLINTAAEMLRQHLREKYKTV